MGYCAAGYGNVKVRHDLSKDDIRKLYDKEGNGDVVIDGEKLAELDFDSLIEAIFRSDAAFDYASIYPQADDDTDRTIELEYEYSKYQEEDVYDTLALLAPITIAGEIEFVGEDDSHWCFKYNADDNCFAELSGHIVYEFSSFPATTEIHATRISGVSVEQNVIAIIHHKVDLDVMAAIDSCLTEWFKTTDAGRRAWEYTSSDYNIGDWLAGMHPSISFTSRFGFVIEENNNSIIEIEYDRVLGDGNNNDEGDSKNA